MNKEYPRRHLDFEVNSLGCTVWGAREGRGCSVL
jgi:hypothetical protein